jgi:hypothetical protein
MGQEVPDIRFLNSWYWWAQPNRVDMINGNPVPWPMAIPLNDMGMNPTPGNLQGMTYGNEMNSIQHTQYSSTPYYSHLSWSSMMNIGLNQQRYKNEVLLPENGWELISQNRGFFPDLSLLDWYNNPFDMIDSRAVPFLLYYNKYTETARIFWKYGDNTTPAGTINYTEISIFYESDATMSGVLRLADGYDRPLDQKSKVARVTAIAPNPGSAQRFFSTDFKMTYDPCVCFEGKESELVVEFKFLTSTTINAEINALGTTEQITTAQLLVGEDFLNAFSNNDGTNPDGGGYFIYKHMTNLLDDYISKYEAYEAELAAVGKHNKKVDRNKLILTLAKTALTTFLPSGTGKPIVNIGLSAAVSILGADAELEVAGNGQSKLSSKSTDKFWKLVQSVIKESSVLFEGMSMFKKMNDPAKPFMPTVTATQMKMKGSSLNSLPQKVFDFKTPGSYGSDISIANTNINKYPIYNEVLGVFALVNTPKFQSSEENITFNCGIEYFDTTMLVNLGSQHVPNWQNVTYNLPRFTEQSKLNISKQFKLAEPLKYYFNPKLNILDKDVKASIIAKVTLNQVTLNHSGSYPFNTYFVDPENQVNYDFPIPQSAILSIEESNPVSLGQSFDIESYTVPIDALNSFGVNFGLSLRNEHLTDFAIQTYIIDPSTNIPSIADFLFVCENLEQALESNINVEIEFSDFRLKFDIDIEYDAEINHYQWNTWSASEGEYMQSSSDEASFNYVRTFKAHTMTQNQSGYDINLAPGGSGDFGLLNLTLTNPEFNGQAVYGCHLNGNTYTCSAWQPIVIQGIVSIHPDYNVIVQSGTEINVIPLNNFDEYGNFTGTSQTFIPNEMLLQIVPMLDLSNPTPAQTPQQIQTFCASTLYQAGALVRSVQDMLDSLAQANPAPQPEPSPIEFIVFPNPTTGASQAGLNLPELATVSISILDITGKVQGRPVQNQVLPMGRNVLNLESEPLASGVYFVQVVVNGEKLTQRLVKQ